MYEPIKNRFRKLTALSIAGILVFSGLTGCQNPNPSATETFPQSSTSETPPPVETTDLGSDPTTDPVSTAKGTVTAEELNVREGVGIKYEKVGLLKRGDQVEILERADLNGVAWGRIKEGWICLTYVDIEGEIPKQDAVTKYQITDPIVGKVIATELNIRSGPSTKYAVAGSLKKGDTVTVTELDGNWGKTEKGWVNTIFVYFEGTMDAQTVKGVITGDQLNVRSGPSTAYESLRKLNTGDTVTIIKQVTIRDNVWGYIGDGWVSMRYVDVK